MDKIYQKKLFYCMFDKNYLKNLRDNLSLALKNSVLKNQNIINIKLIFYQF